MGVALTGTPVIGYVSLNSGSLGPNPFALFQVMGQAAYTLAATEKVYITAITLSTNDSAAGLVTIDAGPVQAGPPLISAVTKIASIYPPTNQQTSAVSIPPGYCRGIFGVSPRATAAAITAAKTVEITIYGYIAKQ